MDILILIGLIFLAVSILISITLSTRKIWRIEHGTNDDPIEHYTEMRDELSGIEEEDVEEEVEEGSGFGIASFLGGIIGLGIAVIVGHSVISSVKEVVIQDANMSGLSPSMVNATNTMFSLFPIIVVIGFVFVMLSAFGLTGSSSESSKEITTKRKTGVKHYTAARDKLTRKRK